MIRTPANDCIVIKTSICSKQGDQKLFNESRTDITVHSLGETELWGVKICPADIKAGPSELATEFDFTFFSHHLTPVKLWDKTQRCSSVGQQATEKDLLRFGVFIGVNLSKASAHWRVICGYFVEAQHSQALSYPCFSILSERKTTPCYFQSPDIYPYAISKSYA